MNIEYTVKNGLLFAQAYGSDTYGGQTYSCTAGVANCSPNSGGTTQEGAPNTGFLGLSQDAAIASGAGALLVAIAIVGSIFVIASRRRANKKRSQEQ